MKSIMTLFMIIVTVMLASGELEDLIERKNIQGIVQYIASSDSKMTDIDIIAANKEQFPAGGFRMLLRALSGHADAGDIARILVKHSIDERTYPYMLSYYRGQDTKELIRFITDNSNADIDMRHYTELFFRWGILEDVFDNARQGSELCFFSAAKLYSENGGRQYLEALCRFGNLRVRELFAGSRFSEERKGMLMEYAVKSNGIEHFEDILTKYAVYFPDSNLSHFFNGTEMEDAYQLFVKSFTEPGRGSGIENEMLRLASGVYNGRQYETDDFSEQYPGSIVMRYLEMMYMLFESNESEFKRILSYFLMAESNYTVRMKLVKMLLISNYIDDGTFLRYYYTGSRDKYEQFINLIAPESPLGYEMHLQAGDPEKADSIASGFTGPEDNLLRIIIDMERGRDVNIDSFMKQYPEYPLNIILMEFADERN
ncbi:MAG: hypothetical protein R6U31_02035 [bacterium]